ncbi:arginine deiminase [Salinispira pacifica]|uniref:Arginine deiminase n=1 Tax=Salinispira pacifica TaxID=1307761 RepID=V5WFL6_9SPIO|nr:arginine deiminase [Salinispira pacifica]AHC14430.1 Arginine deiminase [Salinispira pacifica]
MSNRSHPLLQIRSEIDPLKTILLHRPSRELEQLIPKYLDEMLFEDIPYLEQMQKEHDEFALQLTSRGIEVLYFENLLKETLAQQDARVQIVNTVIDELHVNSASLKEDIRQLLLSRSSGELAQTLLAGLSKNEVPHSADEKRLSFYIKEGFPFYLDPLPNLYFSRDYGTVIGNRLSVNTMKARARKRESMLLEQIARYHRRFTSAGVDLWHHYNEKDSIEGGDILILSPEVIAIGCSARTSPEGIEELAERIFEKDTGFREVLVLQIPFARAYMHLDTVFTMVDRDKFSIFPGIAEHIKVFSIKPGSKGGLSIIPRENLKKTLSESLGLRGIQLIETGGGDLLTAEREQWNDGTNTLAISPGCVVTYRRNTVSNDILRKHNIEVVEIPGSELVRGRGGPRCMSMPLYRETE